jgi:hypothetical protein
MVSAYARAMETAYRERPEFKSLAHPPDYDPIAAKSSSWSALLFQYWIWAAKGIHA